MSGPTIDTDEGAVESQNEKHPLEIAENCERRGDILTRKGYSSLLDVDADPFTNVTIFRRYFPRWLAITGTALVLVAGVSLMPDNKPLEDQCLKTFNTSISELLEEANNFTTRGDQKWCYPWKDCLCTPPTKASPQLWNEDYLMVKWNHTFERNKDLAINASSNGVDYLDIVFYGDSITEHWWGTDLAQAYSQWKKIHQKVFQKYFDKKSGASLNGLPLGIGGDRCAQLLYRIQNGELPDTLHPKVFWLNIGTNDFADYCRAESLAAGNIRIVQELLQRRSEAKVVINSILPRGRLETPMSKHIEWPEVQRANQWFKCFADSSPGVEFFNATSLFVAESNETALHQITDYYQDGVHPSSKGSVGWATAIVERAHELIGHSRRYFR